MVSGHLQEKNGTFYAVLNYVDTLGKRKTKWISTGLPIKGNKKRAEEALIDIRRNFKAPEGPNAPDGEMLFSEYLDSWLEIIKSSLAVSTYASYVSIVKRSTAPYFKQKGIYLKDITAKDIQGYYLHELKTVSPSTVIHYHALIHKALKYAVKIDLIDVNPADKVERPKREHFEVGFYDADEVNSLLNAVKGTKLEIPVMFGTFYGLRRSEVIGLKWSAIDFEQNTLTIKHTVTSCNIHGKLQIVESDTTKTKSSLRTMPLALPVKERLLALREEQEKNRQLCGRSYNKNYVDYVCVNKVGNLMRPNFVSESFPKLLEKNGLRKIRFHDLRHSCASLLLSNGIPMKQIQEWLGRSNYNTTANIYAHLDYSSKMNTANALMDCFGKVL